MQEDDFEVVGDAPPVWPDESNTAADADEVDVGAEAEGDSVEDVPIEKGVPVPPTHRRKYPFHKMTPGHSFEVSTLRADVEKLGEKEALAKLRSSLSSSAASFSHRHDGVKMVVRKTGPRTLRCWCVADDAE